MSESGNGGLFLSYASQDADAACRFADELCIAGVEVWFDQSEFVGGSAGQQNGMRRSAGRLAHTLCSYR